MKNHPKKSSPKLKPSRQIRIKSDLYAFIEKQAQGYENFSATLARLVGFGLQKK